MKRNEWDDTELVNHLVVKPTFISVFFLHE